MRREFFNSAHNNAAPVDVQNMSGGKQQRQANECYKDKRVVIAHNPYSSMSQRDAVEQKRRKDVKADPTAMIHGNKEER